MPELPRAGPHLAGRCRRRARGLLSRRRLPRLRAPRGARRHAGAAGRPHPPAARPGGSMRPIRAPPPKGATGDGGFKATPDMMSILGCSADELGNVLKALGFWAERRLVRPAVSEPPAAVPAERRPRQRPMSLRPYRRAKALCSTAPLSRRLKSPQQRKRLRRQKPPQRPPFEPPASCDEARGREMGRGLATPAQGTRVRPAGAGAAGAPPAPQGPRCWRSPRCPKGRPPGRPSSPPEALPRGRRPGPRANTAGRRCDAATIAARVRKRDEPRPQLQASPAALQTGFDPRFAVRGAELAEGGPGKAQPGLTAQFGG